MKRMDNACTISPVGCSTFKQTIKNACIPVRRICDLNPYDGIITTCDKLYNCNLCDTDTPYYIPYYRGDKIHLQTQLIDEWNTNRFCPDTFGLTVSLCDGMGNEITSDLSLFTSSNVSGWSGSYSYQGIIIDTSLPIFETLNCWNIKFGDNLCSNHYSEKKECEKTITLESTFDNDCFDNYYGLSECFGGSDNYEYSNKIRICAHLKYVGSGPEFEKFGLTTSSVTNRKYYEVQLSEPIPPYMDCVIASIMTGNNILINGEQYYIDQFPRTTPSKISNMFGYSFEVYKECSFTHGCN